MRPPRDNTCISIGTSLFSIIAWDILECTWQAVGQFTKIEVDMNRPSTDIPQISKSPVTKSNRKLSIYLLNHCTEILTSHMLPHIRPPISIAVLDDAQKGLVRHQDPTSLQKVQMKSCTDFPRRLHTTVNCQDGHRIQRLIRHRPHATGIAIDDRHSQRNAHPHRYASSGLNR
jgi:hypothetical protein